MPRKKREDHHIVKLGKNSIFLKKGKTIISVIIQVENLEFF